MNLLSLQPPEINSPSKIISDKEEKSTSQNESIQSNQYVYETNSFSLTNIQILQVIGILEQFKPNNICEFGTGITTNIFESYCKKYNKNLLTIEHSIKYQREHSKMFKLNKKKDVVINNIKYSQTNIYEGLEEFFKTYEKKFDLILIDAPMGETNK